MISKSNEEICQQFKDAVNMAQAELEDWLQTEASKKCGSG